MAKANILQDVLEPTDDMYKVAVCSNYSAKMERMSSKRCSLCLVHCCIHNLYFSQQMPLSAVELHLAPRYRVG